MSAEYEVDKRRRMQGCWVTFALHNRLGLLWLNPWFGCRGPIGRFAVSVCVCVGGGGQVCREWVRDLDGKVWSDPLGADRPTQWAAFPGHPGGRPWLTAWMRELGRERNATQERFQGLWKAGPAEIQKQRFCQRTLTLHPPITPHPFWGDEASRDRRLGHVHPWCEQYTRFGGYLGFLADEDWGTCWARRGDSVDNCGAL